MSGGNFSNSDVNTVPVHQSAMMTNFNPLCIQTFHGRVEIIRFLLWPFYFLPSSPFFCGFVRKNAWCMPAYWYALSFIVFCNKCCLISVSVGLISVQLLLMTFDYVVSYFNSLRNLILTFLSGWNFWSSGKVKLPSLFSGCKRWRRSNFISLCWNFFCYGEGLLPFFVEICHPVICCTYWRFEQLIISQGDVCCRQSANDMIIDFFYVWILFLG